MPQLTLVDVTDNGHRPVTTTRQIAYDRVIAALEAHGISVRLTGAGARARCPAHDGQSSTTLKLTPIEGQVLVHCFAECANEDVVAAIGLDMRDLFDDPRGVTYRYDCGRIVQRTVDKKFFQKDTHNPPELYRFARVRETVARGGPVLVVGGEKDVHACEAMGLTATCCPMGEGPKKWEKIDPTPLYGAEVLIIADRDPTGRQHAEAVYRSLVGHAKCVKIFEAKTGKDASDHFAAGHGIGDFVRVPLPEIAPADPLGAVTVCLTDVTPEHVDWLWPNRLPIGKIVVLDGDPSVGKSTLAVDCAARVSRGSEWPDGAACRTGSVLILSAEDGLADTIRPRLDAAGGDPANVHAMTSIRYRHNGVIRERPVTLADVDEIESEVRRTGAVLVVIDVLMAYLPGGVDSHRDQDVRGVLSGVAAMAERTGCCVLLLRHLNKSGGGQAIYRGGGSIAIIGAARLGLLAAVDPEDEDKRVLAGVKSNLAKMPQALAYQLVDVAASGCARVDWLGASTRTAAELLSGPRDEDERTERDEAVEWLSQYLKLQNGHEASRADVVKSARTVGHSERTLQRAMKQAHVVTARVGFPATTVWRLDETVAPPDPSPSDRGATGQAGATAGIRGLQHDQWRQSRQSRQPTTDGATDGTTAPNLRRSERGDLFGQVSELASHSRVAERGAESQARKPTTATVGALLLELCPVPENDFLHITATHFGVPVATVKPYYLDAVSSGHFEKTKTKPVVVKHLKDTGNR